MTRISVSMMMTGMRMRSMCMRRYALMEGLFAS